MTLTLNKNYSEAKSSFSLLLKIRPGVWFPVSTLHFTKMCNSSCIEFNTFFWLPQVPECKNVLVTTVPGVGMSASLSVLWCSVLDFTEEDWTRKTLNSTVFHCEWYFTLLKIKRTCSLLILGMIIICLKGMSQTVISLISLKPFWVSCIPDQSSIPRGFHHLSGHSLSKSCTNR